MAVGSGRSVPGFDLHAALKQCQPLFTSFGGHAFAAGLQLPAAHVSAFAERFEDIVRASLLTEAEQPEIALCSELKLADITPAFWRTLKQFAPFGPGNMTPIFWARGVRDTGQSRVLHAGHVQLSVQQECGPAFSGIGFDLAECFEKVRHQPFDLAFSLQEDTFQSTTTLRLRVRALRPTENNQAESTQAL